MLLTDLMTTHPLVTFSAVALFGFLWGLQATIGANLGYRRGLDWQTGWLLGLVFGGVLIAAFYSIRPRTMTSSVVGPKWIRPLSFWPSIGSGIFLVLLTVIMEILAASSPIVSVNAPWDLIELMGIVNSLIALVSFTSLGASLGRLWYDPNYITPDEPELLQDEIQSSN